MSLFFYHLLLGSIYDIGNSSQQTSLQCLSTINMEFSDEDKILIKTSGYATWFTAGGAIRIAHYDIIDDVITRKL